MMRRIARPSVAALGLLLLAGCAARSNTITIQPTDGTIAGYSTLALAVESKVAEDVREETRAVAVRTLERVKAFNRFATLRMAGPGEAEPGTLLMKATVTDVRKVSSGARFFAGAMAGRAQLTLDVELVDAASGRRLATHRVTGQSGGTGLSGGTNDAVDKAAEALANLVR